MFLPRTIGLLKNVVRNTQIRAKSTVTIPVKLDAKINAELESETYKPKDHAGKVRLGTIELPGNIIDAIQNAVPENEISRFVEDGAKLDRHLHARHIPMEQNDVFKARKAIEKQILQNSGGKPRFDSSENATQAKRMLSSEVSEEFYKKNYNWRPVAYDRNKAWAYLFGRAAKEYAVILKVFGEIVKRDPEFTPRSFFDFGSGIGTGTWAAAKLWKKSIYEYFLVDQSREMNDLSELILRDGNEQKNLTLKNVFYRQFLPASDEMKSHIVLSAFSLMELPNLETRLDTLLKLWKKCDGYMIVIENGTSDGFKLVEEARGLILEHKKENNDAYVFAPCPHEEPCPRLLSKENGACIFPATYRPMRIGRIENDGKALFSYVIFKKGDRSKDATMIWPRVVRPTQVRSRHVRCNLCTHRGKLEDIVITKGKHSKYTYRCAKKSDWGDRIPIEFEEDVPDDTETVAAIDDK